MSRAHSVSFHVCHEFVQQGVPQISTLPPSSVCEWRQSKDERSVAKQAGTVTNCQQRYTLGKTFWGTEELWAESSPDLTQPSQQFTSLRKCCPDPKAKRSHTDLPSWKSESKPEWISSWAVSERKRRYHHFLHIRRFSNLFKKRNLNTKYFLSFSFFREILVNALNKTEPIYTQICMYIATLLGDVVFCRSPLLFHRTRQLSWSQRGFTVNFWTLFRGTALISNLAEVFLPTETIHLLSVSFIPLTATFLVCFDFYKLGDLWSRRHLTVTASFLWILCVSWLSSFILYCL